MVVVDWREGRRRRVREVTMLSLSLHSPSLILPFCFFSSSLPLTALTLALQNANPFLFVDEEGSLGGLCLI